MCPRHAEAGHWYDFQKGPDGWTVSCSCGVNEDLGDANLFQFKQWWRNHVEALP
jgi:hypothetical protein